MRNAECGIIKDEEIYLYETIRNLGEDGQAVKGLLLGGSFFIINYNPLFTFYSVTGIIIRYHKRLMFHVKH